MRNRYRLVEQHGVRSEKSFTVPLTGLDMACANPLNAGFFVYEQGMELERFIHSVREAARCFPTFTGAFSYTGRQAAISVGKSNLVVKVFEADESFCNFVRLPNKKLIEISDFFEDSSSLRHGNGVFALLLIKSTVDNSCILIWETFHDHTDGITLFRFLKKISDIYHGRNTQDQECLEREPCVRQLIANSRPSNDRYLGTLGGKAEELPGTYASVEQNSYLICIDNEFMGYLLNKSGGSRRNLLNILSIKTHAYCMDFDSFVLYRVLDIRNKGLLPERFSGNGLLIDSGVIESSLARSLSVEDLANHVRAQFAWDDEAARAALSWLEMHKQGLFLRDRVRAEASLEGSTFDGLYSGRGFLIDDLTYFPASLVNFEGAPIWYDSPTLGAAHTVHLLPISIDGRAYVRVNGPRDYVEKFVRFFYEISEIPLC